MRVMKKYFFTPLIIFGLIINLSFLVIPASFAQGGPAVIRQVRVMESDDTGILFPVGLAFSSRSNAFYVLEDRGPGQAPSVDIEVSKLTPFANRSGSTRILAAVRDPINVAFDDKAHRLLIFRSRANQLVEVQEGPDGNLKHATLTRYNARGFGLQNPQGLTVDPERTTVVVSVSPSDAFRPGDPCMIYRGSRIVARGQVISVVLSK